MEQRAVSDHVLLLGKGDAAIADRLVEARDCREAAVGERFVDERPQMLGRLQFGAVGGLEDEADAVPAAAVFAEFNARIITQPQPSAEEPPGAGRRALQPRSERLGICARTS